MSNLKPLKWSENFARSAFHQYLVRKDPEAKKNSKSQYQVSYGRINTQQSFDVATGFATIDDAKTWCWNHYNEKMQQYVAPILTWINYKVQKPIAKGSYLIRDHQGRVAIGEYDQGFYMASGSEKWGMVAHWMPIPEFKQGE